MTHIVIHDDSNNVTHYAEFDDVRSAAAYLEGIVNDDSGSNARLYALDPVEFAVKSYVRVEIGGAAEAAPVVVAAADLTSDDADDHEMGGHDMVDEGPAGHDAFTDVFADDNTEYVDAMAPADAFAPPGMPERSGEPSSGEVRRGLFGR